jgi:hypothetical protein
VQSGVAGTLPAVSVPLAIFVFAAVRGATAAARWLPPLASDRVGRLALLAVCVLLGVALALVGLNVYTTVRAIDRVTASGIAGTSKADILTAGLLSILSSAGPLLASPRPCTG